MLEFGDDAVFEKRFEMDNGLDNRVLSKRRRRRGFWIQVCPDPGLAVLESMIEAIDGTSAHGNASLSCRCCGRESLAEAVKESCQAFRRHHEIADTARQEKRKGPAAAGFVVSVAAKNSPAPLHQVCFSVAIEEAVQIQKTQALTMWAGQELESNIKTIELIICCIKLLD